MLVNLLTIILIIFKNTTRIKHRVASAFRNARCFYFNSNALALPVVIYGRLPPTCFRSPGSIGVLS